MCDSEAFMRRVKAFIYKNCMELTRFSNCVDDAFLRVAHFLSQDIINATGANEMTDRELV